MGGGETQQQRVLSKNAHMRVATSCLRTCSLSRKCMCIHTFLQVTKFLPSLLWRYTTPHHTWSQPAAVPRSPSRAIESGSICTCAPWPQGIPLQVFLNIR